MPFAKEAEVVLAMWREVERQLSEFEAGTPEAEALQSDASLLRDEYQRLVELARQHHRAEPPPFPSEA